MRKMGLELTDPETPTLSYIFVQSCTQRMEAGDKMLTHVVFCAMTPPICLRSQSLERYIQPSCFNDSLTKGPMPLDIAMSRLSW